MRKIPRVQWFTQKFIYFAVLVVGRENGDLAKIFRYTVSPRDVTTEVTSLVPSLAALGNKIYLYVYTISISLTTRMFMDAF